MWFQTECAYAFKRMGKFGEALKKCIEVDRHFTEIIEDQFDFHTYCMRKMTLRNYVDLLRLEDELRSHRFYKKAAHCAINVYLRLHDAPLKEADNLNTLDAENMDPSELKKLKNKQEKATAQQAAARKELHNKSQKTKGDGAEDGDSAQKDELLPDKLERPEDPLGEAVKFLTPLQQFAPKDLDTHLLAFEIYYKKGKSLLMLQSVKRAVSISSSDPRVSGCVLRLQHFIEDKRASLKAPVVQVLDQAMDKARQTKSIFVHQSAREGIDTFIQKNDKSLQHIFVGAQLMTLSNPSNPKAIELATQLDSSLTDVSIRLCIEILDSLKEGKFGPEGVTAAADYQKKCALHFKMSSIFSESSEVNTSSHLNNNGNTAETDSTSEALSKMAISGSSPQLKTESTAVTSAS